MSGRKENELRTEVIIEDILEVNPYYVREFYTSLTNNSYNTQYAYINHVVDFLIYLESELELDIMNMKTFDNLKPITIEGYFDSLSNVKSSTKERRYYSIKKFYKFLRKNKYIINSPIDDVDVPKDNEEHKVTALTLEEIEIVKNNIMNGVGNEKAIARQKAWRNRDYALIMMGISLGLRISSLLEIDLGDIDFNNNCIKIIEKGNKTRTILISNKLKEIMKCYIADRNEYLKNRNLDIDALFISKQGKRLKRGSAYLIIKKYTYNLNKNISPHKLRSTCACIVYEKTGDIYLTAHKLGHSNVSSTKRYTEISKEKDKMVTKIMDEFI